MKSRGMYETPGGTILLAAHRGIEQITLDRGAAHLKDELMPRYAELIRATTFTASEAEIKSRIDAMRGAWFTQFVIQLVPGHEAALADWARVRKAFA